MSFNNTSIIIIIPASKLNAANDYFEKNGYGPLNFQIGIIRKTDPDSQAARGYVAGFQADSGLLALAEKIKDMDLSNVKVIIGNNARKRAKIILDDNGFRLKPT